MTQKELYQSLDYVDHSREKRTEMAQTVLSNPDLIFHLLDIINLTNDPISCKASWILEVLARKKLDLLFPYLDKFTDIIGQVKLDSAVRPVAKVCELLVLRLFNKKPGSINEYVTAKHLEKITTACFDWLIGNHKVAAKAYSMTSLFLLGKKYDWIHPELKMILEQNYHTGSAAYKARARMVLNKLK